MYSASNDSAHENYRTIFTQNRVFENVADDAGLDSLPPDLHPQTVASLRSNLEYAELGQAIGLPEVRQRALGADDTLESPTCRPHDRTGMYR